MTFPSLGMEGDPFSLCGITKVKSGLVHWAKERGTCCFLGISFPPLEEKRREKGIRNDMYPTHFKGLIETRFTKKKQNNSMFARKIRVKENKAGVGGGGKKNKKEPK